MQTTFGTRHHVRFFSECFPFAADTCEPGAGPPRLIATGVAVGASSAFYSIYEAPRVARRQNARPVA
jgi:hypothetical protein